MLAAVHRLRALAYRRRLAAGDPAALARLARLEAAAVEGLTPAEERWVADLEADRSREGGCLLEVVERRFGPIPPPAGEEPGPLRLVED